MTRLTRPMKSRRLRFGLVMLAELAFLVLLAPAPGRAQEIDWRNDYAAARREAAEKDRPLLIDFGTEHCFWCKRLDATTLRDATVVDTLARGFICLRINAEMDPSLAEKLRIQAYPTVVLASPEGKIIDVIEGYKEAAPFQERLTKTLAVVAHPDWMQRDYQEAGKAIGTSDYARAIALLKNVVQDGKERSVQVKARQLLADLEQQSAGRLARARQLADKGQTAEAIDTVTELVRVFAGTQAAQEGAQVLTSLASRQEIKDGARTGRARTLLAQAREDFRTQNYVSCLSGCDLIGSTFGDQPEAAEARQMAAEIRSNPEWLRQACDSLGEQMGTLYLSLAEAWMRKGQPQQAVQCLERLAQMFPGSREAEAAQVRLAQIQGQPATRTVEFKKP